MRPCKAYAAWLAGSCAKAGTHCQGGSKCAPSGWCYARAGRKLCQAGHSYQGGLWPCKVPTGNLVEPGELLCSCKGFCEMAPIRVIRVLLHVGASTWVKKRVCLVVCRSFQLSIP